MERAATVIAEALFGITFSAYAFVMMNTPVSGFAPFDVEVAAPRSAPYWRCVLSGYNESVCHAHITNSPEITHHCPRCM